MLAPQSDDEIRPIEQKLQELDPLLGIRWNPRSRIVPSKTFDVYGLAVPPSYQGRWEVTRLNNGQLEVVYVVRFDGAGGDAYRSVGWWLVEFMQRWDSAQSHFRDEWKKAWAEHDRAERAGETIADDGELAGFLDEAHFNIGGPTWIGRGF